MFSINLKSAWRNLLKHKFFSFQYVNSELPGIILASPVAWYIMHLWLQDFAYRVNMSWRIFASAGLLSLIITLLMIGFHTVRSAIANPVKSLRTG